MLWAPSVALYCPGEQSWHVPALPREQPVRKDPAGQGRQALQLVCLSAVLYWPRGQGSHTVLPLVDVLPAEQSVHEVTALVDRLALYILQIEKKHEEKKKNKKTREGRGRRGEARDSTTRVRKPVTSNSSGGSQLTHQHSCHTLQLRMPHTQLYYTLGLQDSLSKCHSQTLL